MPLTTQGYIPRTPFDWYERLKASFDEMCLDLGKAPPRWKRHEFVNMVATLVALSLSEIDEAVSGVQDSRSINNASGSFLRELAALTGVVPDNGTQSTVTLLVSALASANDVLLSKGTRVQGGGEDGKALWETTDDVIIPATGTNTVNAQAVDLGAISAAAYTLDKRFDSVSGWSDVTNQAAAILGTDPETDAQIRTKILRGSFGAGSRSPLALRDSLTNLDGVQKAIVVFNDQVTDITVSTRTVPACGMAIWLWPNTISSETQQRALSVIYARKDASAAISYPSLSGTDGVIGEVAGADGLPDTVGFWYVLDFAHKINVEVESLESTYTLAEVSDPIKAVVSSYFDGRFPGDPVRQNDLVGAIAAVTGVGRAAVTISAEFAAGSGSFGAYSDSDSFVGAADRAVLDSATATPVVVTLA